MAKINLNDLQGMLSKRGREAFHDETLQAEILSLDPKVEGDAFIWDSAQGNPSDEDYTNHKAKYHGRVETIAERNNVAVSVQWTTDGRCVVSLAKPAKGKRK